MSENNQIENALKNGVEICPELQELISKYRFAQVGRPTGEAPPGGTYENRDFYVAEIPVKYAYNLGLYLLNKKLVRYGLDNDPELEHLRTPVGREDGNYHDLNVWLGEEYAEPRDIRYAVLAETCLKENETFLWYLQYTDNEQEMEKLKGYLDVVRENQAVGDDDYYGDISYYNLDITNTVSQNTAKEMTKVSLSGYMNPQMLSGKFKGLEIDYEKPSAKDLDGVFYMSQKERLFHTYKGAV